MRRTHWIFVVLLLGSGLSIPGLLLNHRLPYRVDIRLATPEAVSFTEQGKFTIAHADHLFAEKKTTVFPPHLDNAMMESCGQCHRSTAMNRFSDMQERLPVRTTRDTDSLFSTDKPMRLACAFTDKP